jgi:hypothetical protein
MEKTIVYIDGFNLYFGLRACYGHRFMWLDLQKLAASLLQSHQSLVETKYFTSRITGPIDKSSRQSVFIDALGTLRDFQIFYGRYQRNPFHCRNCGNKDFIPNEKMTDVNIATEMLCDAFSNRFESAILISGDADLVAPVQSIVSMTPKKHVTVAFPPRRQSYSLQKVASQWMVIGRASVKKSLFPIEVITKTGFVLKCPEKWLGNR